MKYTSFNELLESMSRRFPEREALRYEANGVLCSMTFSRLFEAVNIRKEDYLREGHHSVGILCDGSITCVIDLFAANLAGLQVTLLDPSLSAELLAELLTYADVDTLSGPSSLCQKLSPSLTAGVSDGQDRFLFFTSGTTSRSKAVILTGRSLCASAWCGNKTLPLHPDDVVLCLLPLSHVFGFVCGLLWGLSSGAAVALGRGIRHYMDDLDYFRPTVLPVVPLMLRFLLSRHLLNTELRLVLVGAGTCSPDLLRAVEEEGVQVSFGYGLTETSSGIALSIGNDPYAMKICPGIDIQIADDGEIRIFAPDCMMQGYYKASPLEASPIQDGYLSSGDLGFLDEYGLLHITGRKKEMLVLCDGTKIFLPEYESRLSAVLPGRDFAVIEKDNRLILCIHGEESEQAEIQERILSVMKTLPRGQQIDQIRILPGTLPRTATGKIRRYEL